MKMVRWVIVGVCLLVGLSGGVYVAGAALPRTHVARVEGVIAKSPQEVAAIIRDVRAYPSWRDGLAIERVAAAAGAIEYVEVADGDRVAYRLTEPVRDAEFVTAIVDESLPYGGRWTISLTPEGAGARVRIQENGEVRDPLYRFFSRYVFGHTSSMKAYLNALGATEIAA
ncbi:MAG: SRPBCC family protein [Hyphomonadaceae bacterium]|nr:SRPBCC family protein [Hyphomonadaceae bacterium]